MGRARKRQTTGRRFQPTDSTIRLVLVVLPNSAFFPFQIHFSNSSKSIFAFLQTKFVQKQRRMGRSRKKSPSSTRLLEEARAEQRAEEEEEEEGRKLLGQKEDKKNKMPLELDETKEEESKFTTEAAESEKAETETLADPWALIGAGEEEEEEQQMPAWKKYARIVLPHIGLILLSLCYIIGGALVFYHLERPNEVAIRKETIEVIEQEKRQMMEHIWELLNDPSVPREKVEEIALERVDNMSRLLFEAFDTHYVGLAQLQEGAESEQSSWSLMTAIFFTSTLLTTIGYGNLVPVTPSGRMFCIFYALFGVPLILITVTDIGKFLSEHIVWLYTRYSHAKHRFKDRILGEQSATTNGHNRNEVAQRNMLRAQLHELGLDNVSIPITLIAAILLGYMTIGAVLLATWEHWALFDGFYFSFITMTTVGFGDIVPTKREFFLFDLFYIVVGLAITTMCIDLVGIEYIEKIHYFGRAISGARFALVNVGGKMVRVPDLVRCAHVLQQKYGQKKMSGKRKGVEGNHQFIIWRGAYAPKDLAYIRFIDVGSLASFESISSLLSRIFTGRKSREPSLPSSV